MKKRLLERLQQSVFWRWLHRRWSPWAWVFLTFSPRRWRLRRGNPLFWLKDDRKAQGEKRPLTWFRPMKDGIPYRGFYIPFYRLPSQRCFPVGKLLPTRGEVAIPIEDDDVQFAAVGILGDTLKLQVVDPDIPEDKLPTHVVRA